jgi:peptide/nickel transport system permease protein
VALVLNFLLPRLIPGNPVDAIIGQLAAGGGTGGEQLQRVHEQFTKEFGLDKPLWQQFFVYVGHVLSGNFGTSFGQNPA